MLDRAIDARIRADIDSELRAKGCRPAQGTEPEFLLNYRLASEAAEVVKRMRRVDAAVHEILAGFPPDDHPRRTL